LPESSGWSDAVGEKTATLPAIIPLSESAVKRIIAYDQAFQSLELYAAPRVKFRPFRFRWLQALGKPRGKTAKGIVP